MTGSTGEAAESNRSRRSWIAIATVAVVAVTAVVAVALAARGDDEGEPATTSNLTGPTGSDTTEATTSISNGDSTGMSSTGPSATPPSSTTAPTTAEPQGSLVPLGPVQGTGEAEICTNVLARLGEYRAAIVAAGTNADQLGILFENLTDFESDIYTQAEQQDWGDRIIEDLTTARRHLAEARAAATESDEQAVEESTAATLDALDTAVARADCPT